MACRDDVPAGLNADAAARPRAAAAAYGAYPADTTPNPVKTENAKPGTPGWELLNPALAHEIEGYASSPSVNRGGTIDFYVNTVDASFRVNVYRMGWYGGVGAREVFSGSYAGVRQPAPAVDAKTYAVDAGRWSKSFSIAVPASADPTVWASGVYLAKLTSASGKDSYMIFVVRDDARPANFVFQTSETTWQAYNAWGGHSLYSGAPARVVSFNRPYFYKGAGKSGVGAGDFLTMNADSTYPASKAGWEYNMVRWLEREGYDVTYAANLDTHEDPTRLANRKAFLSVGHDEYWSWAMRNHVEALRDRGVNLGFFSANSAYYQVRFAPDAQGRANRLMLGYKSRAMQEDPYAIDGDASNDHLITVAFAAAPVNRPEAALLGVGGGKDAINADIVVTNAGSWVFGGTGLANGDKLAGLLGYEDSETGVGTPANAEVLARSPYTNRWNESGTSHMVTYAAPSGATVFATGSIQWAWGLDDYNAPALRPSVLNPRAQQVTRNLLGRMQGMAAPAPVASAPAAPSNLTASRSGSNPASVKWVDNATDEAAFELERAANGGAFGRIATLGANATAYSDAGPFARRTTYGYRVRATNATGASAYSNTASFKTK